jgi:hypothetical protein
MSQIFTPFVIVSLMPLWVAIVAGLFVVTFGRRIARQDRTERLAREAARAAAQEEMLRRLLSSSNR